VIAALTVDTMVVAAAAGSWAAVAGMAATAAGNSVAVADNSAAVADKTEVSGLLSALLSE